MCAELTAKQRRERVAALARRVNETSTINREAADVLTSVLHGFNQQLERRKNRGARAPEQEIAVPSKADLRRRLERTK